MDFQAWLKSSFTLGWLSDDGWISGAYRTSLTARIIAAIINIVAGAFSGSFLLSWMVAGEATVEQPKSSSKVIAAWIFIRQILLKWCYALGDIFSRWTSGSLIFNNFFGFIGRWWRGSMLSRLLLWWNTDGEDTREPLSWLDYATFLVVGYAVIDYFLRMYVPALAGIWDELLFIALVGLWVIRIGTEKLTPRQSKFVLPFLAFTTIFFILYLLNSLEPQRALEGLRVYVEYVLWFFIGFYLLNNRTHFKWLCDLFIFMSFLLALYGVYQYYVGVEIPSIWIDSKVETTLKTRVFSIIGSPNILGSILVLSISMTLASFLASRSYLKKLVYTGVGAVMLACLVFTFSRGAWIAVGLSVVLLGLWLDRRIIWGLVIIALLTPVAMPSVYDRLACMTTEQYKASSERGGRIGRWDKSLAYWQTAPTAGVGLGQFGGAVAKRYDPDAFYTDNFYLKTGVETGWIGLFSFLLLILVGLRLARRSLDETDDQFAKALGLGIFAGLVGIAAHNSVENVFEVPMMSAYFWFFMGLLTALGMLKQETGNLEHEAN